MPWPYCPNCQASHRQFMTMVRDVAGNPLAWACSNCQHWIRTVERIGDATVAAQMATYGSEFIPANTVVQDPTLGTRYSCGNTCDLVLSNGAAYCTCGLNGLPSP